ncbi:unnamed protein product [Heterobilharzia americana]|nr:unnamed protein product [Heterobilharzia americana]
MGGAATKIAFEVCVVSGDYSGDELGPGVNMVMFDHCGNQSPTITLDNIFQNDIDYTQAKFTIDLQSWSRLKVFKRLHHIEFWCTTQSYPPPAWFLDRVIIRDRRFGMTAEWKYFFFPVHQWISPDHQYVVHDCEAWIPQFEPFPELREEEVSRRMQFFAFFQRAKGLPVELQEIPSSELFSSDSRWDIEPLVLEIIERTGLAEEYTNEQSWNSLDALGNFYKKYNITEPVSLQFWMMNDICFGAQRIRGCNPFTIQVCRTLPKSFQLAANWLKPQLEGWTLRQMVAANRLYMLDYHILEGLSCKRGRELCAPLAVFFYTEKRQLKPIAIQVDRNSNDTSSIILPTDPTSVWLQAKLWVNLADACHHMIVGRLLTHLILESIYVSLRRNMSQSHPIYHLVAPHFRSILPVTRKLKEWTFENGWISRNIQLSRKGIKQLLDEHLRNGSRGVYDPNGLGNYPYREDALLIYHTLEQFVSSYVRLFYPEGTEQIIRDNELQSWRHEIAIPGSTVKLRSNSRVGHYSSDNVMEEVFGLATVDEVVKFLMGILYLDIIIAGSALRLPMFDEYGFPAQYPLSLFGQPPIDRNTFCDSPLSGPQGSVFSFSSVQGLDHVLASLPNRQMTVETVLYTRLASRVQQSVLGQFESDFIFKKKAVILLEQFRNQLADMAKQIDMNNNARDMHHQYRALDPSLMPNYPGI